MSLEVKLFVPRRIVCEAAKITEENLQKISKFELMSEGQLVEPILR